MGTHVPMLNNTMCVHMKTPYVSNLVNIEFPQTWEPHVQCWWHPFPWWGTHSNVDQYITKRKTPTLALSFSPLKSEILIEVLEPENKNDKIVTNKTCVI